jgi:prolyl oligopeptidase
MDESPFAWLETPDSEAARAWLAAQDAKTRAFLRASGARRAAVAERLGQLSRYERFVFPIVRGGWRFYYRKDVGAEHFTVFAQDVRGGPERTLLDPMRLDASGATAVVRIRPSPSGALVAYATVGHGSEKETWRVRQTRDGRDRDDALAGLRFAVVAWDADESGFFYNAAPPDSRHERLLFHALGTPQSADVLVREAPAGLEPSVGHRCYGHVCDEGRYLVVVTSEANGSTVHVADVAAARAGRAAWSELVRSETASFVFVGSDGDALWLRTDLDAPNGRLVAVDAAGPARGRVRPLIVEQPEVLERVAVLQDRFLASYLANARSSVRAFARDGAPLADVPLPRVGVVSGFEGRAGATETFFQLTTFTHPPAVYRYEAETNLCRPMLRPRFTADLDALETEEWSVPSHDGAPVPVFVTGRRGLPRDGSVPACLTGYGGFGVAVGPTFAPHWLYWLERGGRLVTAGIRGGGERGPAWHEAGRGALKTNGFLDFEAVAAWLVATGLTTRERLVVTGASNGGLLVGACLVRRPELFGAAVPVNGVHDMLRYPHFTVGWQWRHEYGSPDEPAARATLRAYSPVHNARAGVAYPPTLVVAGAADERVSPTHSYKFAAALQAAQSGAAPILLRRGESVGHGVGKSTTQALDEWADIWAFVERALGA